MTINFTPFWKPNKINWNYPINPNTKVIDNIKSKGAKAFLSNIDQHLTNNNLIIKTRPCSDSDFSEFIKQYTQLFTIKKFDILANKSWYKAKLKDGKEIHIFQILQRGKIVASKIFTIKDHTYRSAFKISQPDFQFVVRHKNASLGLILDYLWLEHVSLLKPKAITGGTSRNLFGVTNRLGYLIYKLRVGFQATIPSSSTLQANFEQSVQLDNAPDFWLAFLSVKPQLDQSIQLYYQGNLKESYQYQELTKLIQPTYLSIANEGD